MALISFLDVIDRTDLLFHEVRQLQTTLIHQVGIPELYTVLRFEEAFLWGDLRNGSDPGSWTDRLCSVHDIRPASRDLAREWVIRFPLPSEPAKSDALGGAPGQPGEASRLHDQIVLTMGEAIKNGYLSRDARRTYYMLAELQVVKQNLLREKIITVHAGLLAFGKLSRPQGGRAETDDDAPLTRLLLRCWTMRTQLAQRVPRIGNIQRQIEQLMDLAIEQDPRPSAARRRDQGIYNSAIVDRCVALQDVMGAMLDRLGSKNRFTKDGEEKPRRPRPIIMHRWDLVSSSMWREDIDAIYLSEAWDPRRPPIDELRYHPLRYINSSYWMPDRPDMLPQLAHEVAHMELSSRYFGFSINHIGGLSDDALAEVMNRLRTTIRTYEDEAVRFGVGAYWTFDHMTLEVFLKEIAADIVSTLATGPAYLFTTFLERLGSGFEQILEGLRGSIDFDLDVDQEIFERLGDVDRPPAWHLRLRAVIGLLAAMKQADRATWNSITLADTLVEGIKKADQAFYAAFADKTVTTARGAWEHWANLCQTVERIMEEAGKGLAKVANPTITPMRDDKWPEEVGKLLRGPLFDRLAEDPRFLHAAYRAALPDRRDADPRSLAMEIKMAGTRTCGVSGKVTATIELLFAKHYLELSDPVEAGTAVDMLFRRTFDIPWQFALITTIDLLKSQAGGRPIPCLATHQEPGEWLRAAHRLTWLGRDVFQLALEFWVWRGGSRQTHVDTCRRVIHTVIQDLSTSSDPREAAFCLKLKTWLRHTIGSIEQNGIGEEHSVDDIWGLSESPVKTCDNTSLANLSNYITEFLHNKDTWDLWEGLPADLNEAERTIRLAQLRDYARWSTLSLDKQLPSIDKLTTAFGHQPNLQDNTPTTAIGSSRNFRLERISTHAPLRIQGPTRSTATGQQGEPSAPIAAGYEDEGLRWLFTSPWADSIDSAAGPCIWAKRPRNHARCLPFLGRYDMMRIELARTNGPASLPYLSIRQRSSLLLGGKTGGGGERLPLDEAVKAGTGILDPFFARQQFGLPFQRSWVLEREPDEGEQQAVRGQNAWATLIDRANAMEHHDAAGEPPTPRWLAARYEWFIPAAEPVGLAALSVQLAQRSARLTIVRQIVDLPRTAGVVGAPWSAFRDHQPSPSDTFPDNGFVIDGWGDILCIFNVDSRELDEAGMHLLPTVADLLDQDFNRARMKRQLDNFYQALHGRLRSVMRMRNALANHFLVLRTELAYTPLAGDIALRAIIDPSFSSERPVANEPNWRLHWSFQFSIKPDRTTSHHHRVVCRQVDEWQKTASARRMLVGGGGEAAAANKDSVEIPMRLVRQAGAMDYRISFLSDGENADNDGLNMLNELLFGEDGAIVHAYETLAADLKAVRVQFPNLPEEVRQARVFVPGEALLLSSMLKGQAASAIDHTFTTLGIELLGR